jgi:hypothetical protein
MVEEEGFEPSVPYDRGPEGDVAGGREPAGKPVVQEVLLGRAHHHPSAFGARRDSAPLAGAPAWWVGVNSNLHLVGLWDGTRASPPAPDRSRVM